MNEPTSFRNSSCNAFNFFPCTASIVLHKSNDFTVSNHYKKMTFFPFQAHWAKLCLKI